MNWVCLLSFICFACIHLYGSYKCDKAVRAKTKPFILLSLLGFYAFSTSDLRITIVLALAFSWLGDILLIPSGVKWFTAGGISFMTSHILFIAGYSGDIIFEKIPVVVILALAFVFTIAVVIIFSKLSKFLPKVLLFPMFMYLLLNGAMNSFAILRMISDCTMNTVVTCIGAILFFISDSSLFFVRFNKDGVLKTHFIVMLTYSIGEFLIVLGLI